MYKRVLVYSHDTFGLGHLRRCRAIAHALVRALPEVEVHIISGSRDSLRFAFADRVLCTPLPGIRKQADGTYQSLNPSLSLPDTLALRRSLILDIVQEYQPDCILVDKEPWGLSGEMKPALEYAFDKGIPLILGLRDILDAPDVLRAEWHRKMVWPALTMYRALWVYGQRSFYDVLQGVPETEPFTEKVEYLGYLRTPAPLPSAAPADLPSFDILVMDGGGGDGLPLMERILATYAAHPNLPPALIVLGPQMDTDASRSLRALAATLPHVHTVDFLPVIEQALDKAKAVIGMCGYNTFCEILSYQKPAAVLPRSVPRLEQTIRAERAAAAGLLQVLPEVPLEQAAALYAPVIRALPASPAPAIPQGFMECLDTLVVRMRDILEI